MPHPRYLLLATADSAHGRNSGYTHLADYLPDARLIKARRAEPSGIAQRMLVKLLNHYTATRWYRLGSLNVERQAKKVLNEGFRGLVHLLWGDRDWGFLDRFTRKAGVPLCATFHSCPDTLPDVIAPSSRLQGLDAIILMSAVQRPFFLTRGVPPERIHVIEHGIDCSFFSPRKSPVAGPFTLLSVGNYRRNFTRLQEVCRRLSAEPDIRIKVVAPPAHREKFRGMPNVDFCSGLSDAELLEAYRTSSCLLMTLDAATANNALLEAMACGLPVVSEDIGGIGEYTGRDGAVLCAPGSVDELVAAVLELRGNPELTIRLAVRSRDRAEELDWSNISRRTVDFYEGVLSRHAEDSARTKTLQC